jgi:hypothetical protein
MNAMYVNRISFMRCNNVEEAEWLWCNCIEGITLEDFQEGHING